VEIYSSSETHNVENVVGSQPFLVSLA